MNTDQTGAHNTGVVLGGKGECGMDIEYTVHIWREGQQFVAHAMPLDVMSCGPTADQARQALVEAVELFLATAADVRTLDEVLVEAGYQPSNNGCPITSF